MSKVARKPNITIETGFDSIKIKFGNLIHLRLKRSKLLGFQSWRYGEKNYFIEYTMSGGNILCEYDDIEKWKLILLALEKMA